MTLRRGIWAALLLAAAVFATALSQVSGPDQLNQCDKGTFTITVENTSPTQSACDIVIAAALPEPGFAFVDGAAFVTLHSSPDPIAADPTDGAWDIDAIVGTDYELPPGGELTVAFDLATSCAAESGNIEVQIDYADCQTTQPYQELDSLSIEILPGALIVSKTPSVQDASVGEPVKWTITVESTGLGAVSNVVITDVLGPGLAYASDTGGGANVGQTTTWDKNTTPALELIPAGGSVGVDLTAQVASCDGLYNDVDAAWGCDDPPDICFDTAIDGGTAIASLSLIVDNPALSFTPPNVTVGYCTDETAGLIQITNSGAGTASNVELCCEFSYLTVDPSRLPPGTTYSDGCFQIPDIAPSTTFDLTFYVLHPEVDWCVSSPSGPNTFQLTYANDCGIPFVAYPQFSTLSSEPGPSLNVTKSDPPPLRLGEVASYDITVAYAGDLGCYSGSPGSVTIADDYPDGFTVVDADGGADNGDTITWTYDPAIDPPFARTVRLQVPDDCAYCVGLAGTIPNTVTATTIDCCGCELTASATAQTTILCEGLDDVEFFTSTFADLAPSGPLVRCDPPDTFRVKHTYDFSDDARLDDLFLDEFTYFVEGNGKVQYAGALSVTGASVDSVADGSPGGRLEIRLVDDATPVTNRSITFAYDLTYVDLNDPDAPPCANDSANIDAGVELDPGATGIGFCSRMYGDEEDPPMMAVQAPAMSVSIDGIPEIQESCATYPVIITLERTPTEAAPYDVRLVLTNNGGSLIDVLSADCAGVTPTDGTTCSVPITGANTYEWRFADGFVSANTATITIPVTIPCGGPLADLSVVATFDDLCDDDDVYDDECSTSASDQALLSLSADVYTRKSPEILYATTKYVSWSVVVHNTGNGTAYNVWVEDVLGSGLIYDPTRDNPLDAAVSVNVDHNGAPINGASFLFALLAPRELKTITVSAELVACDGLTNDIAVSWGCGGADCQTPRADSSSVVIPPVKLVATSYSPTPLDVCTTSTATVIAKNAGVATVYEIVANVTLPNGIAYAGNPRYSTDGGGSWQTVGIDPPAQVGQTLTWTSGELSELGELLARKRVDIQFDISTGCDFSGGNLTFQAGYDSPCGKPFDSNVSRFSMSARTPDVTVEMTQDPDDAIPCGASATWTITVTNNGPVSAAYVRVVSILGDGWSNLSPSVGGTSVGQITTWEIADLGVGPGNAVVLTLAADSVGSLDPNCDALNHQVEAAWACAPTDASCLVSPSDTVFIAATRTPPVSVGASLVPTSVEACTDSTTFTLTVTNGSTTAPAANIDARVTLPAGLSYVLGTTGIDCGSGSFVSSPDPDIDGQILTWYDTAVDGGANDACATLAAGGQIRIRFGVTSSCYFTAQNANSRIFYKDCCGGDPQEKSRNTSIGSKQPNLTITKTPDVTDATCGDTVTWTIVVENTGNAIAEVVRIEDFLGANLSFVSATGGGEALATILYPTPPAYDAAYGWELGPLAAATSTSVQISAQLVAPPNCTDAPRTNTAVVTWACGSQDGDLDTVAYDCESGDWDAASSKILIPNLSISSSDITPTFACAGDGITPGSGQIELVVRNTGDRPITSDFTITLAEATTGYSVTDTFTNLADPGALPLAAGDSETLVFPWAVTCSSCQYTVNVTLDTLSGVCECDETDNAATRNETITLPDVVVDSADLAVACAGDGRTRIQGPITLRNDGCGDPLTGTVRVRFRLFAHADCVGAEIDEIDAFTVEFTGLSIAANGGTQVRNVDVTRTLDACDTCQISIRIEVDDNDAVCECDGTNNDLCAGTFPIAFPDLTIADIDFSQLTCTLDGISGVVRVTVENDGCGDSGPFALRLETDGCLSFSDEAVAGLAAAGSTAVDFAVAGTWTDCTSCSCTFTATVDPGNTVCECDGTNNGLSEPFTSTLPDLEISGAVASIGCSVDGQASLSADVTVRNTGCADVTNPFDIRVTIYEDADCTGAVVDTWDETITGRTVADGGSTEVSLTTHVLSQALCAGDCAYSARFEVDAVDDICECDGTDNTFCLSSIPSELPDLVVTDVDPSVDCRAGTASVTAEVGNVGCGDAAGVVLRLTSPSCGLSIDSAPIDLAAGASQDVVFGYTPNCGNWNCTYAVTADPDEALCECDGTNALTFDPRPGIGSIGDRVWFDFNEDGVQDPGEDGIPNVTLILRGDLDGDGSIDYTAEVPTDANGEYLFDDLPAGDYTISVDEATLPDGLDQTYDYDGLGTPHTSDYTLAENEHHRGQDFGYRGSGSIGDYVWVDIDGDGVQDPGEKPIENVTVTLEGDVDGDGIDEILTTTTDADGLYLFDFLPAGDYTITVDDTTLPDGLVQTYDYDGTGSSHTSDYALAAGEDNREQDFGYRGSGSIGDFVWYDFNGDGAQDPGEPGIESVTVTLVGDVDLDGIDDVLTTTTDADGLYLFEFLPAGDYTITVDDTRLPDGFTQTYDDDGLGTPHTSDYTLGAGEHNRDQDFGYATPALSVDKTIADIKRGGISIGTTGPVEPGDLIVYRFVIRNVGPVPAYGVGFDDTFPPAVVTETDAPADAGTFDVTAPAANGSLGIADGVGTFTASLDAEIGADGTLTAEFFARVTSAVEQGLDLTNTAHAFGLREDGTPIPPENVLLGDTTDEDAEDPDADDIGIATVGVLQPALSVDKTITDITRSGASIGIAGPVQAGDIVSYQFVIRNVGGGTAYGVEFTDTLPPGMETVAGGSYSITAPTASGTLALTSGIGSFTTSIDGTIGGGQSLTAQFKAVVTSSIEQGVDLVNTAEATGFDGFGTEIPDENVLIGDVADDDTEDPDADDIGVAIIGTQQPALSVDKIIVDIVRRGSSIGASGPVEPGDVIVYQYTIRNTGLAAAYAVDFSDTLPTGLVVEADAPGDAGTYTVSGPAAGGSLALADGVSAFTTSIAATISGGEQFIASYSVLVTSDIEQGVDLVNTAEAMGVDGYGTEIPDENVIVGDTSDDDAEDPDADDTGIAVIGTREPALSVDKVIADIVRNGSSIGTSGPVEPGDVIFYRYTIRNVGLGTAYAVEFTDTLPAGLVVETGAPGDAGSYTVSDPAASGTLALADAVGSFATSIGATIAGGGELVAKYSAFVTSGVEQGVDLINVAAATGVDGAGTPIPAENPDLDDTSDDDEEDPDADDTGITLIAPVVPALSVDKRVIDVLRGGTSVGVVDPLLYSDVIVYQYTIRNVGLGTAYAVEFTDTLPTGIVIETDAPGDSGGHDVTAPAASGSLNLVDGATSFTTSIDATIAGGERLTATYTALVTPGAPPAVDLINVAVARGEDGAGTPIPDENATVGDTSDDDVEDPDADDTGIASIRIGAPALVTRKSVSSIRRQGLTVDGDTVEPGDTVTYEVGVTNVGDGPAYRVELFDELPPGFLYDGNTDASWPSGGSTADPLGAPGPLLAWPLDATLESNEDLVLRFDAFVTSEIAQAATYTNTITAFGEDGAGEEIPPDNRDIVPGDDDPDDTSDVSLVGAVPALVTDKSIVNVRRGDRSLGAVDTIEVDAVLTYGLRITNVGLGTAYDVDVRDFLPDPFEYISGTTQGDWPFRAGTYTADPSGAPGPTLLWDASATLGHDEAIVLTFEVLVAGVVSAGNTYTNELYATGRDGAEEDIPANNADDVPDDTDPDDRDTVTVTAVAEVPALVTSKRVTDVFRDGASTADRTIEEGDIVRFELAVRNVGPATAYRVGIDDRLPFEFDYVADSTRAAWPRGSASSDPLPAVDGWIWNLDATLQTGDLLVLSFDALVVGPLFDGNVYTNRMHAFGEDASGEPIPEDQRDVVPGDIDSDDSSDVSLIARSAFIEGEGGLIAVPILRKRAEVLGDAVCEGRVATVDRLWFQTDIAMFAASELELLGRVPADWELLSETLLPTWLRTAQEEGAICARDNLLQTDVLSSIGVPLAAGPRIERLATERGISAEDALASRLDALADRAGLDPTERPRNERWIFLEHAEGEPRYETWRDEALGPSGDWTIVDERIVGSALGMGLLKQVIAAESLLVSERAVDRYLGWVLLEVMANKVIAIDEALTVREDGEPAYVPHVHRTDGNRFAVEDADTHLFDQLSLLGGLARLINFLDGTPAAWVGEEAGLCSAIRETAIRLIGEVLGAIEARHVAPSGAIMDVSSDDEAPASTTSLGLLLVVLEEASQAVPAKLSLIDALLGTALEQLALRQANDALFATTTSGGAGFIELAAQLAGIRGLLVGYAVTNDAEYAGRAQIAFDALDQSLWEDRSGIGLYASARFDDTRTYCYTPLEIGLAVGALRELASVSIPERRGLVLDRLSGFVRSVVDEAALQLSNALPAGADVTVGSGWGEIGALVFDEREGRVAPVLQQHLCLEDATSDEPCAGWHALPHDPWYQTDVSMYASYMIQNRIPAFEDHVDANLVAVVFHSSLGVPFREIPRLRTTVENIGGVAVDPIALPYASGSPRLSDAAALVWDPATFDTRIVASAVGMTLLREAQEVRQFLDTAPTDPRREQEAQLLAASILEKLNALREVRIDGPTSVDYVSHAARWSETDGRLAVAEDDSRLLDQASLVWGLSEAYALLDDPRSGTLMNGQSDSAVDPTALAIDLLASVLSTLETAHLDPNARILVDSARPSDGGWILDRTVSTVNLGLTAAALERAIDVFGDATPIGEEALALLTRIAEFVRTELWLGVGEYVEELNLESNEAGIPCNPETFVGQLGALRVLLAAERHLGLAPTDIEETLRAIDARFWNSTLLVYQSELERIEWCVTPLDLGMAVDTIDRAADHLEPEESTAVRERLVRHVDRILDAVRLQLPSEHEDVDRFAPVFDRRICLRPIGLVGETGWAHAGDIVRYTVSAENSTDEMFIDLLLEDTLPEGVTLIATEPASDASGDIISWTFDRLSPSEERTWQLLVRVNEDVPTEGENLVNCATLTYTNLEGEPQPPRETCAETRVRTLDDGREDLLSDLPIWYVTDEAMHLASVLDDLACREGSAWNRAETAHQLAVANLGILLGDSDLGVPLPYAPRISDSGSRDDALASLLDAFAKRAGLPRAPRITAPILLPYEAGMPVLAGESGFIDRGDLITPAALGWTLVEEVAFLDGCGGDESALGTYLRRLTAFTVDNQIEWLSQQLLTSENVYLPHGMRFTPTGDDAAYSVSDPRSTAYDQASLLLGLLHVADAETLDRRTKLLAQQIVSGVFDQLARHWDDERPILFDNLNDEVDSGPADWADAAIVARALDASTEIVPRRRDEAAALLEALSRVAIERGRIARPTDEAARLTVLLIASRSLDDTAARSAFLDGWQVYKRAHYGDGSSGASSALRPRPDWTFTPRELAIRLTLLSEIVRSVPGEGTAALRAATMHVDRDVLAAHVQLVEPRSAWLWHTRTACFDLAPVFAHLRGPLLDVP